MKWYIKMSFTYKIFYITTRITLLYDQIKKNYNKKNSYKSLIKKLHKY